MEMSEAKMNHFKEVARRARQAEEFIVAEAKKMGIELSAESAAIFRNIVTEIYGDNMKPVPVDPDENIGSTTP